MKLAVALIVLLGGLLVRPALATDTGPPPPAVVESFLDLAVPDGAGWQHLHVSMLALAEPRLTLPQRLAEGRAAMLARFPGAVVLEGEAQAQFKLFGVRWRGRSASWLYNAAGSTPAMPAPAALEAIRQGSEGWKNAASSGFHFDYLGETTTATGCNGIPTDLPKDGQNVVGWGHIAGGFLGFSCYWSSTSLVTGTPYLEMTEFDIILEPTAPYSAQTLQALAMHEFGHSLGLEHTEPSLCPGQAMCAGDDALIFTTPQKDDLFGVLALYGVDPNGGPPVPPGNRPFRLVTFELARD